MNEQQFKDLRLGQEIKFNDSTFKVIKTYPLQKIIMAKGSQL